MLNVNITSDKGSLYTLDIQNTQLDDSKNIGGYSASLSGVGLETPLTVKLRKFNRSLGAVKLTSRVLGRIFRKHMDKLVTTAPTPVPAPKTRAKRVPKETKIVETAPVPVAAAATPAVAVGNGAPQI
jgi:hypothetical protein